MRKVYLVGAGPGNPELTTIKAQALIKKADVILYDRLVNEALLKDARDDAELIYVGKKSGKHTFTQEEINALLFEKSAEGKVVVRLKGGDPFIFGRGGEELKALKEHGIDVEIVPGVSSAIAVPALAGIPLTDRRYASSLTIVTGHEDPAKKEFKLDYSKLNADTIVILMGITNLGKIVSRLLESRDKSTPVAIIERGSTSEQRVTIGTLENIVEKAEIGKVKPPGIIVVGEVVKLRREFSPRQ